MLFTRTAIRLWAVLLVGAFPFTDLRAGPVEQEPAFRDNFYDVEIRGSRCWIVGYYGTILHSSDGGLTWRLQKSGSREALFRVAFVDPEKGWLSGAYGTILHTENGGKSWRLQQTDTEEHLFGLTFLNERVGWAVGSRGKVLFTENGGKSWLDRSLDEDVILNDVAFGNASHGWVVGEFGRIYRTTDGGGSWIKQRSPIEVSLISGKNRSLFRLFLETDSVAHRRAGLLAFGLDGVILRTQDGNTWGIAQNKGAANPTAAAHHLFDAARFNGIRWAVGERGTLIFSGADNHWRRPSVRIPPLSLNGIAFGARGLGLVVGNRGLIFRTQDGGKQWQQLGIISGNPNDRIGNVR